MTPPSARRRHLALTRRGRLLRTGLVLLLALALALVATSAVRALGRSAAPAAADALEAGRIADDPDDADHTEIDTEIVRTDTVGAGTWSIADPVAGADPDGRTVHTYALRVEDGIGIEPARAAEEVAGILADERGWRTTDAASFEHVADPATAEFTISIASPPTVDELCLPARTNGRWSCRVGEDVVLNSDRWLHRTPTYDDTSVYRAYMINHEVGHLLGHDHELCGGDGLAAPVMLQQSIDLGGCLPNAWPTDDGTATKTGDETPDDGTEHLA